MSHAHAASVGATGRARPRWRARAAEVLAAAVLAAAFALGPSVPAAAAVARPAGDLMISQAALTIADGIARLPAS